MSLQCARLAAAVGLDSESGGEHHKGGFMKLAGNRLRLGAAVLLTAAGVALAVSNLASAHNSVLRPTDDNHQREPSL